MTSGILQQVLADQKMMVAKKDRGIPRLADTEMHLKSNQITVISGVRRSGKSTLTLQLADRYPSFQYISFDDERLMTFSVEDFNNLLIEMKRTGDVKTLVLDEVQLVPGWERFVRRLHDEGCKVIITGSNARLLSSELATHLTGRYLKTELFPFSFAEFLHLKSIDADDKTSDNQAVILSAFQEYLEHGGFPEYLKIKEKEVLKRIFDDIIYRDLIVRFGIRNVTGFKNLSNYIFTNFTSELSLLPLTKLLGLKSPSSVRDYVNVLSEGYLIFELLKYNFSLKKQYISNRKMYVIDNGLRNSVSFRTSADAGRLLENAVFLELKRRWGDVWYYRSRNDQETDFIVNPENPVPVQICHDLYNPATRQREMYSLEICMKDLNRKVGYILTMNEEEVIQTGRGTIFILPAWKWMLSSDPGYFGF